MTASRVVPLEFARGIASIIVVFHHFALAFIPALKAPVAEGGLLFTPLYLLLNGSAAVVFFFVLSGYVLTASGFRSPSMTVLVASVVKRLPRLMLPAGLSIFAGLAVILHAGDYHVAAAQLSGSAWLRYFGNAPFPVDFVPSAADALKQSLLVFLLPDRSYYNSNLWTMFGEFYGSMIVFAVLAVHALKPDLKALAVVVLHIALIVLLVPFFRPLAAFVVGSLIAYVTTTMVRRPRLPRRAAWLLLAVAVAGFSTESWWSNLAASAIVIVILLFDDAVSRPLSGRAGVVIGMFSFPLYLVHTLVILSVTSFAYVALHERIGSGPGVLAMLLVVTLVVSLAASLPLVIIDHLWARWLGRRVRLWVEAIAGLAGRRIGTRSAR